jgi:SAM-dependent methyltransferase
MMGVVAIMVMIAITFLAIGILLGVYIGSRAINEIVNEAVTPVLRKIDLIGANVATHPGEPDELTKLAGGYPVPSHQLIQLVTPGFDAVRYLQSGAEVVEFLCGILERNGTARGSLRAVFDFGCGCGRVLRHFPALGISGLKLYGDDYNPALIEWCKQNLPIGQFQVNGLEPPLNHSDQAFDFVYAISVFTHLTEPLQFRWLDEMARILVPGGHLLITCHGSAFLMDLDDEQKAHFQSGQLVVKYAEHVGENVCGAYHPVQYVKEKFTYAFDILEIVEQTNPRWQDAYLLRKK